MRILRILKRHKLAIFIVLLSFIGAILRSFNLNWGSPFYFHPDERNIASAIVNLQFPNQMNPHFFAYGSFPIYLIYFTVFLINSFHKSQDVFIQGIFISRFYSAFLSILIIPSLYLLGKKLEGKKIGIIAAAFGTFCVGFIQFAHFGTFEMWLTFLGVWLLYFSLDLTKKIKLSTIFIVGAIFGLLMSTKISSFPLIMLPTVSIFINLYSKKKIHFAILLTILKSITILCVSFLVFMLTNPYVFLNFSSFISSMRYESSLAIGTLPVFYTGEFFNSIPIVFQFIRIYPFLLNPLLTFLFIPSFVYILILYFKKRNPFHLLLITCFLLLFLPQTFLSAKWTRYIVATLPFMYLIIAIGFFNFIEFLNKEKHTLFNYQYTGISLIVIVSFIFSVSYFITVFVKQDSRIHASLWAKKNIPRSSIVLSEIYDMGIVPFNQYLQNITLFNFYDLDHTPEIKKAQLNNLLLESEYVILPSQRILKTRLINKDKFPIGNKFYNNLLNGTLDFRKIYETSCDVFCKITYLGDPIFSFEQTVNVFDRPNVIIFKKI